MNKYLIFVVSITALSFLAFKSLNDELSLILKQKFEKYVAIKNPDKIYVHTDRDLFYKGETIWFKAYITNSSSRKLQEENDILVVQLFNKFGESVLEKKFHATSGLVKAQLDLPDSLQGTYLFVAYNQWQLNFGQDHIFKKKIKVEAFQETNVNHDNDTLDYDFQIFPEGGMLVENLQSRVGFKATSTFGLGADVFGYLIRNGSDTLLTFASGHAGIGSFIFIPETGNTYKVVVEALGIAKEFSIPIAEQEGVVLTVKNEDASRVNCLIQRSKKYSEEPFIIGLFQQGKLSEGAVKTVFGQEHISFSKGGLHPGVAVITLFDKNYLPLAERVIFINQDLNAEIEIQINAKEILPRKKSELIISLSDKEGNPLEGELSLAVIPSRFSRNLRQPNIKEYLLLSSEVKGEIENPGYYFLNDKNKDKAIDNLLLVQGWRKFNWKEIKNENLRLKYSREEKIILKGKVYQIKNNLPFRNNSITASVGSVDPYFQYIVLDELGTFSIDASQIPDGELHFQSTAPYENGIRLDLEESSITSLKNIDLNSPIEFYRENELRKVFAIYNSFDLLKRKQPVVAIDKKQLNAPYDMVVDLDDFVALNDMAEIIKEIVPGVKIRKKKGLFDLKLLNMDNKLYYKYNPLFMVDGIPVYDLQIIMNLDHTEVKLIEVIRSKEGVKKYGHLGIGGVFQIRTKTGSFMPPNVEGIASFDYKGVERSKEFFSPKYKTSSKTDNMPDFRNTLLWKSDLSVDLTGKSTVEFYFSDELEDVIIEVQGLTKDGVPVYGKKLIQSIKL